MWQSHYDVSLQSCLLNHIDVTVIDFVLNDAWRFTGIYSYPDEPQKYRTWDLLRLLHSHSSLPWLCAGDFSEIIFNIQKKGGALKSAGQLQGFRDAIDYYAFQDMGFEGYPFTWSDGHEGENNIQLRIDHAFGTESFLLKFQYYKVVHGKRFFSDHWPLMVEMDYASLRSSQRRKIFRFEEC